MVHIFLVVTKNSPSQLSLIRGTELSLQNQRTGTGTAVAFCTGVLHQMEWCSSRHVSIFTPIGAKIVI
ncbi:hypothetical protein [Neobacillus niacini]|uniref:hypothetical protein n=1 Tax=Neobacillus niacini TaxID=86668 RepID=UPI0021CB4E93|nr:hypothetical protein [Neobacillus niacini]